MIIAPVPRNFIRTANWHQSDQRRQLQRSEWTGRTRETLIGPADRWSCAAEVRPMKPDDLTAWRGFQARIKQPGSAARVQAVEQSQFGLNDNLVRNGDFVGGSTDGWSIVPAGSFATSNLGAVDGFYLITGSAATGATNGSAVANGGLRPLSSIARIFLSANAWIGATATGTLSAAIYWFDAASNLISLSVLNLMPAGGPLGIIKRYYLAASPPVGATQWRAQFDQSLSAGLAFVGQMRVSSFPERALAAAGTSGPTLHLTGLAPGIANLPAGSLVTIALPSGDEQLITLTADLVASAAGTATAQLASPLREMPTAGAAVELARPWALMRAIDPMAWSVDVGQIYAARTMQFEEAF